VDTLVGHDGDDYLSAGDGDDFYLEGSAGADTIDGGAGIDEATYWNSDAAVNIDLTAGVGLGGFAQGDVFMNVENIHASTFNDTLRGDGAANHLRGEGGNDLIDGAGGNDSLYDGRGNDTLSGVRLM